MTELTIQLNGSTTNNNKDESVRPDDVLLGRGGATNNHLGNRNFRSIVLEYRTHYLVAKKTEKIKIARDVVSMIHRNGGRFLRRCESNDTWVEVSLKRAQEKASQALREGLDVRHGQVRSKDSSIPASSSSSTSTSTSSCTKKPRKPYTIRQSIVSGKVTTAVPQSVPPKNNNNNTEERIPTKYFDEITSQMISSLLEAAEVKKSVGV